MTQEEFDNLPLREKEIFADAFTVQIQNKTSGFEGSILKEGDDFFKTGKDEKLYDFLRGKNNAISLGMGLRRWIYNICRPQDNSFKLILPNGNEIDIRDFRADDYDYVVDEWEEYRRAFLAIKALADPNNDISKTQIKNSLTRSGCTRQTMFKIAFALGMNEKAINWFLKYPLQERGLDISKACEAIAYFCLKNKAYRKYQIYLDLCHEYNNRSANNCLQSPIMCLRALEAADDKDSLFDALDNCRLEENYYETKTMNYYKQYVDELRQIISELELEDSDVANEKLASVLIDFWPRDIRERVDPTTGNIVEYGEYIRAVCSDDEDATVKVPEELFEKLPTPDRLRNILNPRNAAKPDRRDLLYMLFCHYWYIHADVSLAQRAQAAHAFEDECNALLNECGFGYLYSLVKFDLVIMLSLNHYRNEIGDPWQFFTDIMENAFIEPEAPDFIRP